MIKMLKTRTKPGFFGQSTLRELLVLSEKKYAWNGWILYRLADPFPFHHIEIVIQSPAELA